MRRTTGALLTVSLLVGVLAGCGTDTPEGTLSKDQVSDEAKVQKTETINNQVTCQGIDNAEDEIMHGQGVNPEADKAATSFNLSKGKGYEYVDNSVWVVSDPKAELAKVSAGIDECIKQSPDFYAHIDSVPGFPDAVGYTFAANTPDETRRILVPIEGHVVVVGVHRQGKDSFIVEPEDLLKDAVAAAKELDE